MSPHATSTLRSRRVLRVFVLLFVLGLAVAPALWIAGDHRIVPRAVEVAVRDHLYLERVDRHSAALLEASEESGVDPYLLAGISPRSTGPTWRATAPADAAR